MYIGSDFDDYRIRKDFGIEGYERAVGLASDTDAMMTEEIHPGVYIITVRDGDSSFKVLRRDHSDRRILLDCDCGSEACAHIAAVLIRDLESIAPYEDDEEFIEDIRERIGTFASDVLGDPDYDEDANHYDYWEIEKYGLSNDNDEVEHSHTDDILSDIIFGIGDPDTAVTLIGELLESMGGLEYDNGGFERAFRDHDKDLKRLFSHINGDTFAALTRCRGYIASVICERYREYVQESARNDAYESLKGDDDVSEYGKRIIFERGDYEIYVEKNRGSVESIVRVIDELERNGDTERASGFAHMLVGKDGGHYNMKMSAIMSRYGLGDEASQLNLKLLRETYSQVYVDRIKDESKTVDIDAELDRIMAEIASEETYPTHALVCLAGNGRSGDVDRYLKKVGYSPNRDIRFMDHDSSADLCKVLEKNGFPESAAIVGRGLIRLRLDAKDPGRYGDAAEMLRIMDGMESMEGLKVGHSEFRSQLQQEYPNLRKFWGLYKGTWR